MLLRLMSGRKNRYFDVKLAELEKKLLEDQEKSVLRATSEAEIRLNAINAKVEN